MKLITKEGLRIEAAIAERQRQSEKLLELTDTAQQLRHSIAVRRAEFARVRDRIVAEWIGVTYRKHPAQSESPR